MNADDARLNFPPEVQAILLTPEQVEQQRQAMLERVEAHGRYQVWDSPMGPMIVLPRSVIEGRKPKAQVA